MKKGMILYVTEGKDEVSLHDFHDLTRASATPGISAVYVATMDEGERMTDIEPSRFCLNRLSDHLRALARTCNAMHGAGPS